MTEDPRWEEMHARTGDNLAAAREILKDAGTVTRWSRKLVDDVRRDREARQRDREARQQGPEPQAAAPDMVPAAPPDAVPAAPPDAGRRFGDFVLVVRLARDLDLVESPQLLRLLQNLATGQGEVRQSYLEEQGVEGQQRLEGQIERRYLVLENRQVVVDLRGVKIVDGSGLSCLIAGHRALVATGLRLAVLLTPASQPARVFGMTNLGKIIPSFGSLDEL